MRQSQKMSNINREGTFQGEIEGGYRSKRSKSSTPDYTADQQSEQDTHTQNQTHIQVWKQSLVKSNFFNVSKHS